jgi:DNA-binding transcriptional regulator YiaG
MPPPQMTPAEIDEARRKLGLSVSELARMLDTDQQTVRRWRLDRSASTWRPMPARAVRLLRAYLDGHRPEDWPG